MQFDCSTEYCRTQQFINTEEEEEWPIQQQQAMVEKLYASPIEHALIKAILHNMISNIYSHTTASISEYTIIDRIRNEIYVFIQFVNIESSIPYTLCIDTFISYLSNFDMNTLRKFEAYVKLGGGFNQTIYTHLQISSLQERMDYLVLGG